MYNIVFVVYDFLLVNFHFNLFENVNALSNDDSSRCPLFLMKGKEYCFLSFEFKMMTIFMSLMIFHVQTVPCVPLFLKRVLFSFIWNWNIDNFYVYLNFMYSRNIVQIRKASKKKNWMISLSSKIILLRFLCQPLHTQILYCSFSNFSSYVTHSNLDIIKK